MAPFGGIAHPADAIFLLAHKGQRPLHDGVGRPKAAWTSHKAQTLLFPDQSPAFLSSPERSTENSIELGTEAFLGGSMSRMWNSIE